MTIKYNNTCKKILIFLQKLNTKYGYHLLDTYVVCRINLLVSDFKYLCIHIYDL